MCASHLLELKQMLANRIHDAFILWKSELAQSSIVNPKVIDPDFNHYTLLLLKMNAMMADVYTADIFYVFSKLLECLQIHYGMECVVLIDNFDAPVIHSIELSNFKELGGYIDNFINICIKVSTFIELAATIQKQYEFTMFHIIMQDLRPYPQDHPSRCKADLDDPCRIWAHQCHYLCSKH